MAVPKNLVWEQSTSTGTGNKTLSRYGGFARVSEAFSTGDAGSANPILFFANKDATSAEWEVVQGYMSDANTFVPGTVIDSSNGGSAVTFTAGLKFVTCDVPAQRQVYLDSNAASPPSNDGASIGKAGTAWSDAYLAAGGEINWNNGAGKLYESSGNLIWLGGDFDMRKTGSSPALVTSRQDTHSTGIAIGSLYYKGRDNGGTSKTYAIAQAYCDGNTAGSENGSLHLQVMKAGTVTDVATLSGTSFAPTTSDGLALGTTSKMWSDVLLASGGVLNWNNGAFTLTEVSGALVASGDIITPAAGKVGTAGSNIQFQSAASTATVTGVLRGADTGGSSNPGWQIANGAVFANTSAPLTANRTGTDGILVNLNRDGSAQGSISVSGGTVSYNAFMGAHWARFENDAYLDVLPGTILDAIEGVVRWKTATFEVDDGLVTIDYNGPASHGEAVELSFEGDTYKATVSDEEPENTLVKHVKVKVSDTANSAAVYGIFLDYGVDDGWNDVNVAALGNYFIRMAAGQSPQIGDLVVSDGTGCGMVQDDDVIRSRTVAKITNATPQRVYDDGSFLVPCVLYCG